MNFKTYNIHDIPDKILKNKIKIISIKICQLSFNIMVLFVLYSKYVQ